VTEPIAAPVDAIISKEMEATAEGASDTYTDHMKDVMARVEKLESYVVPGKATLEKLVIWVEELRALEKAHLKDPSDAL
jgi:hypothetical protein